MNIWKWVTTRVLRLPQAHNSVSDIIGASNWNAIKTTVGSLLQSAISKELTGIEKAALVDTGKLITAALSVFKGIDAPFSAAIQASVVSSVQSSMDKTVNELQEVILTDLTKVIGLR